MKYNCSDEFNLELIYKKLTSKHHAPSTMVKAGEFFSKQNELALLQAKMGKIMRSIKKSSRI